MGGKGGGQNTVTNNSAPPPEVMEQYRHLLGMANTQAGQPLQQYGGQMVAGFTPDQLSAFQGINNAQGISAPYMQQAQGMLQNSTAPLWQGVEQWSPDSLNKYMSPYTDSVVNATMANMNENNAQQQTALQGNAISKGAWGGDRAGIASAELSRQQSLADNQTIAGLRNQGFNTGMQAFQQQQGAQLGANTTNAWLNSQGAFGMANLGNQAFQNSLQGAGAQLAAGNQQQQQNQANLNIPYEQFLQQQAFPYQNLSWLSGISTGLGGGMGGTSTSSQPGPSGLSQVLGAGMGAAGIAGMLGWAPFASDRRIKKDIERVGKHGPYPIYDFKYKGDDVQRRGVMAQDVEKINPDAVGKDEHGIRYVDYSKLARGGVARGIAPRYSNGGFTTIPDAPQLPHEKEASGMDIGTMMQLAKFAAMQRGGGIGYAPGGMVPDVSLSYIPNATPTSTMAHSTIPGAPQLHQQSQPDASQIIGMMSAVRGKNGAGNNSMNPLGLSSGDDWTSMDRMKLSNAFENAGGGFGMGQFAARGGEIQGFAPGGASPYDDDVAMLRDLYGDDTSMPDQPDIAPQPQGMAPPPPPDIAQMQPQGIAAPAYGVMPNTSGIAGAEPTYSKPDPWAALAMAGFATAAGKSPYAMENIGSGALEGLKNYSEQKKAAANESYNQGSLKAQGERLYDQANEWRSKLTEDTDYHKGSLENQRMHYQLMLQQYRDAGWDIQKLPNGSLVRVNKRNGQVVPVEMPAGMATQNANGFEIGTVPDGLVAPVVPEQFNTTARMTPGQASIQRRKYQDGLVKDDEAANQAATVSNEFNRYLSVNKDADSGGLSKIGIIRDLASAFSEKDATADSINKTLTFNSLGFERTPGMRITQAEFLINREAMPGRGNPSGANRNIANYWIAKMQTPQEWADFKRDYMLANDGDWNEALGKKMFEQYKKANPIFDPEIMKNPEKAKVEQFKLNDNRKSLNDYAASGGWSNMGILGMKKSDTKEPAAAPEATEAPAAAAPAATPPAVKTGAAPVIPQGVPPGSQWSPSRKMWRDSAGKLYDQSGKPV